VVFFCFALEAVARCYDLLLLDDVTRSISILPFTKMSHMPGTFFLGVAFVFLRTAFLDCLHKAGIFALSLAYLKLPSNHTSSS
jgi:hypothetical protein